MSVSVMTPIVFCASLVPWASETRDAVKIWPTLNPSRSRLRVTLKAIFVARYETRPAVTGARIAGIRIFESSTPPSIAPNSEPDDRRADEPAEQRVAR